MKTVIKLDVTLTIDSGEEIDIDDVISITATGPVVGVNVRRPWTSGSKKTNDIMRYISLSEDAEVTFTKVGRP